MKLVGLGLVILLVPSLAAAQSGRVFIDGGALFGARFTPSAEGDPTLFISIGSPTYEWNDVNRDGRWQPGEEGALLPSSQLRQTSHRRVAPGGSAAVGTFLSSAISLRLEVTRQGDYSTTVESRQQAFASSVGAHTTSITDTAVAAGWGMGQSRRVSVTYLAGIVFRRQRVHTEVVTSYNQRNFISPTGFGSSTLPATGAFTQNFKSTSFSTGVMAGMDVAVKLSGRFDLVPQFRMVAFDQDWSVRPGIVLRWKP